MTSAQLALARGGAETSLGLDKADDAVEPLALPEIGHGKRPFPAHAPGVGVHFFQRCADMGRNVDLVDDEKVRPGDAGTPLGVTLVTYRDVDHLKRQLHES